MSGTSSGSGFANITAQYNGIDFGGQYTFTNLSASDFTAGGGVLSIGASGDDFLTLTYRVPIPEPLYGYITIGAMANYDATGNAANFADTVISGSVGILVQNGMGGSCQLAENTGFVSGPTTYARTCTAAFSFYSPGDVTIDLHGGFTQNFDFPLGRGPDTGSFSLQDPLMITAIALFDADGNPLDVTQFQAPQGLSVTPNGIVTTPEPPTGVLLAICAGIFLLSARQSRIRRFPAT